MKFQVHLIIHGRHLKNVKWRKALSYWREAADYEIFEKYTSIQGHGIALAVQAIEEGATHLITCGGDGTLNECVNGYMSKNAEIPMGVLPMGTGNDFIKMIAKKGDWKEIHENIIHQRCKKVDLAFMEFTDLQNKITQRYFVNVMDVGLGGEVVQKMARSSRKLGSFLTYQKAILQSLIPYRQWNMDFQLDDLKQTKPTLMLAFANAKWFGSGLGIAPRADIEDGLLEVIHLGKISLWDYLWQLPNVKKTKILHHPEITYSQCKESVIRTPGLPIDCDGEFIGFTPLSCKIVSKRLNVLISY